MGDTKNNMKINNSTIFLKDIRCYAYHGVAPQENLIGNEYVIDLKLKVDNVIKTEMAIPSKLLEHAGGRIVQKLFETFPDIEEVELRLSKRNPPMGADIDAAGIELYCSRK